MNHRSDHSGTVKAGQTLGLLISAVWSQWNHLTAPPWRATYYGERRNKKYVTLPYNNSAFLLFVQLEERHSPWGRGW